MGKYKSGVLGEFRGQIGPVIGSSWLGIPYMRSKGRASNKPPTIKQLAQRQKFRVMTHLIAAMGHLFMQTFKDPQRQMTARNMAFACNFGNQAVIGEYPSFALDYNRILISKGELLNVFDPVATALGQGLISFNWNDNSGRVMANASDKSIVAIYCPELKQAMYTIDGAPRLAGVNMVQAGNFLGKKVETWISFITADGSMVATSIYTGQLTVL